ncbi:MAG: hypothetical protein GY845_12470 [Planctomycetes bacterium]|nr:hypothetical protein [Planctomycetota bacterium]
MSMFSICTAFIPEGQMNDSLKHLSKQESIFTSDIGVVWRRFFKCSLQPHIIWAITEWKSEKHHNDAAQTLMKTRRDDRIASILFGPDPYFEIFCKEAAELSIGDYSDDLEFIIVGHGLINPKAREKLHNLWKTRVAEQADRLQWFRLYPNTHNSDEFVVMLGFADQQAFEMVNKIGDFRLEEYLFTGLSGPFAMSNLAGYNQFLCEPLLFSLNDEL